MVNAEWDGIALGIMNCPFVPVLDGHFFPGKKEEPFFVKARLSGMHVFLVHIV